MSHIKNCFRNKPRREERVVEAKGRQEASAGLTLKQRLEKLDRGNTFSKFQPLVALRERTKLQKAISAASKAEVVQKGTLKGPDAFAKGGMAAEAPVKLHGLKSKDRKVAPKARQTKQAARPATQKASPAPSPSSKASKAPTAS